MSEAPVWRLSAGGAGATIYVSLLVNNEVQISNTVVARGGHKVTWEVTNSSGTSVPVQIKSFQLKKDKLYPESPFVADTQLIDFGTIEDGGTEVRSQKVKSEGRSGAWVYKYTLVVGSTEIDPELVIEWP